MINEKVVMLAGAGVGAQFSDQVVGRIPSLGPLPANAVTLIAASAYLMFDPLGLDGNMGAFVDGVAIGLASDSVASLIPGS